MVLLCSSNLPGTKYIVQAGLKLTMKPTLTSSSQQSSCFCLSRDEVAGMFLSNRRLSLEPPAQKQAMNAQYVLQILWSCLQHPAQMTKGPRKSSYLLRLG